MYHLLKKKKLTFSEASYFAGIMFENNQNTSTIFKIKLVAERVFVAISEFCLNGNTVS